MPALRSLPFMVDFLSCALRWGIGVSGLGDRVERDREGARGLRPPEPAREAAADEPAIDVRGTSFHPQRAVRPDRAAERAERDLISVDHPVGDRKTAGAEATR